MRRNGSTFSIVILLSEKHSSKKGRIATAKKGPENRAFPNKKYFVIRLEARTEAATTRTTEAAEAATAAETATLATLTTLTTLTIH